MRNTHRIGTHLRGLAVCLTAFVVGLACQGQARGDATLDVSVYSPALPATDTDIITLAAVTSDEVLPSPTWQTITTSLQINGFDIEWNLVSNDTGQAGVAVVTQAGALKDVGPLPAGTYNVTATWAMYSNVYDGVPPQYILDLWSASTPIAGPRTGTFQFTVVPEPATCALMSVGLCMLGVRRRS